MAGDPRAPGGARWAYHHTEGGTEFALEGVLFVPPGRGPFPGVVISHGRGGSPAGYSARVARTMTGWGLVAIAPEYTHAAAPDGDTGLPAGAEGASAANVARALQARALLACLGTVDPGRIAAHGHSMGAFVTGETIGTERLAFRVASHTAGGVGAGVSSAATRAATAAQIQAPYQLHHGDADTVVPLAADLELARILASSGTVHELRVYPGYDHGAIADDPRMLEAVREFYAAHGLF